LLDVLAGRKTLDSGVVLLNGQRPGSDFRRLTGYCEQQDCLLGTLTVRETLQFSAELRLPASFSSSSSSSSSFSYPYPSVSAASSKESAGKNKRAASIQARVSAVIKELGLEACADSLVGTEFLRGISGGEKKRTNLGRELVTAPSIIFMDEPTTGKRKEGREGGRE
jgi:ATP-binding cassette subfamily G (WHITE) protein 2